MEPITSRGRFLIRHIEGECHVQDRRHASCEDSLAVRGVGYLRACNYLLVNGLVGDPTFNHAEQASTSAPETHYASLTNLLKVLSAL